MQASIALCKSQSKGALWLSCFLSYRHLLYVLCILCLLSYRLFVCIQEYPDSVNALFSEDADFFNAILIKLFLSNAEI